MVTTARTDAEITAAALAQEEGPYPQHPHPVTYYSSVEAGLFDSVINHYMSNYHGDDHHAGHAVDTHAAPSSQPEAVAHDTATPVTGE